MLLYSWRCFVWYCFGSCVAEKRSKKRNTENKYVYNTYIESRSRKTKFGKRSSNTA